MTAPRFASPGGAPRDCAVCVCASALPQPSATVVNAAISLDCTPPCLLHLDEFELHAVGTFEEAHAPSPGDDGLLEDMYALHLELFDQHVELVGIDRDVLHAVLLLAL